MAAVIGLTLLVFGGTWAVAFFARPEEVVSMTAQAEVARDGSAQITETIGYRFSGVNKHGIFRDVPGLLFTVPGISATDNGRVAEVQSTSDEITPPETHIRVGSPSRTITGDHVYVVSYPLPKVIGTDGELEWNGVGTGWAVDVDHSVVDVAGPWRWTNPTCEHGSEGSTTPCTITQPTPGLLVAEVGHLGAHEGVTVRAETGPPLAVAHALPAPDPVRWPGHGVPPFVPATIAAVTFLVAGLALRGVLERLGRDEVVGAGATDVAFFDPRSGDVRRVSPRELDQMASIEFAPPKELAAWQGGIVSREEVQQAHRVAWLLDAAIAGLVELHEADDVLELRRPTPPAAPTGPAPSTTPGPLADDAATLVDRAFDGRDSIELGSYDPAFAGVWASLDRQMRGWMDGCDLWEPHGRARQRVARVLGAIVTLFGLAGIAGAAIGVARNGSAYLVLVGLAALGAGLGLALRSASFELMVRTPKGSGLWVRVESFRRFLHESEAEHALEAAKRGVLRQYTAWAMALGEVDHWSKAVEAAGAQISDVDRFGVRDAHLMPMLVYRTQVSSVHPSSGGSGGFGGGGGVGGGFGGGGGGSW